LSYQPLLRWVIVDHFILNFSFQNQVIRNEDLTKLSSRLEPHGPWSWLVNLTGFYQTKIKLSLFLGRKGMSIISMN
jgi:hypothetical protein